MFKSLLGQDFRRQKLLKQAAPGPLQDYYTTPFPNPGTALTETNIIALDLETTGLDISKDQVLSIGLVNMYGLSINLDTAWHRILYTSNPIPENTAIIHAITDDTVALGENIKHILPQLLDILKGKVLLAHHASIEIGFLNKLCQSLYDLHFIIPVIDTEILARRYLERTQTALQPGQLRLFNLRERFGLPAYRAHNALSDAIAAAELFLALANELYPKLDCKLKDVLTG